MMKGTGAFVREHLSAIPAVVARLADHVEAVGAELAAVSRDIAAALSRPVHRDAELVPIRLRAPQARRPGFHE